MRTLVNVAMTSLEKWIIAVLVIAFFAFLFAGFQGCATMQRVAEFLNPQYHEIVIELDKDRSLVFNAPIDWPVDLGTLETLFVPLIFPLMDCAIQGDGYIYEIIFNMETLDIYALTKTPGIFYNFDLSKATWYIYINERPIISDAKGFSKHAKEILKMLQKKTIDITI